MQTAVTYLLFFICVSLVVLLSVREGRERRLLSELTHERKLREAVDRIANMNGILAEQTAADAYGIEPPRYADGSPWRYGDTVEFTVSVNGNRREGSVILHTDHRGIVRDGRIVAIATGNRSFLPEQVSDVSLVDRKNLTL